MRSGMHESRAAAELFFGFVRIVEEWDHVLGCCDVVVGDVCEARERGSEQVMIGCESWGSSLFFPLDPLASHRGPWLGGCA